MAILTNRDITAAFDRGTYSRGEAYHRQGRVAGLSAEVIDDDYVILRAQVRGSGYVYSVEVSIETAGAYRTDIVGECSCPVAYDCKHAVATCLAYLSEGTTKPAVSEDGSSAWLNNLQVARQPRETATSNEFLAYILDDGDQPGQLCVRLVECKLAKNGKRTKGRRLNQDLKFFNHHVATAADNKIIALLASGEQKYGAGTLSYLLQGELGAICLQALIETARCFWQSTSRDALTLTDSRPVSLAWHADDDGRHELRVASRPPARVLDVSPPLFLDEGANAVGGLLDVPFNADEWHLVLNAPKIGADQVETFSKALLRAFPDARIPPPQDVEIRRLRDVSPTPCLVLMSEMASHGHVHFVVMSFDYEGLKPPVFPALPTQYLNHDDGMVSLSRDLEFEQDCITRLSSHGLESQIMADGCLKFVTNASQRLAALETWRRMLTDNLPALVDDGWQVTFDDSFSLSFVEADTWQVEVSDDSDWFELGFDLSVDGKQVELLPMVTRLLQEYDIDELPDVVSMQMDDGRYLKVPMDRLKPVYRILYELFDREVAHAREPLRLGRFDAHRLADLEERLGASVIWHGGEKLRLMGEALRNFNGLERVPLPTGTTVELREYQRQGVDWLQFLRTFEFNGILGDDMGLGKTIQTLVHIQIEKNAGRLDRPCLIIAPTSLMSTWNGEVARFTPELRVLTLQGQKRHLLFDHIEHHDVVLSTYPLLVRDQEVLLANQYHTVILDEAQVIKNPSSKASRLVRSLNARHRLCLTGTPMENHLGELWSLFDFLMPGFLGDQATFSKRFRTPIEQHGDDERQQQLASRIAPFLLRRRKDEVLGELPPKTEIVKTVHFEPAQAALYESIRLAMEKRVRQAVSARGFARSHITILDALLKLRQTCCDPRLLKLEEAQHVQESAKLELLMEMLTELLEEGRRILVFSQFTQMLGLIEHELRAAGMGYVKLTGQTKQRDRVINSFKAGEVDLFLVSLKAGGVGLNLTEADTVIHYDPWWNPAAENQATDRTYRIGQDKPVFVYKLITENTLEEKILAMQARKQMLADGVYQRVDAGERFDVTPEDLQALLGPQES